MLRSQAETPQLKFQKMMTMSKDILRKLDIGEITSEEALKMLQGEE